MQLSSHSASVAAAAEAGVTELRAGYWPSFHSVASYALLLASIEACSAAVVDRPNDRDTCIAVSVGHAVVLEVAAAELVYGYPSWLDWASRTAAEYEVVVRHSTDQQSVGGVAAVALALAVRTTGKAKRLVLERTFVACEVFPAWVNGPLDAAVDSFPVDRVA